MSTLSLNSTDSQSSTSTARTFGCSNFSKVENLPFDKCPECRIQFDFIKRTGSSKIPLILSCKHTVCESCIRKLAREQSTDKCPICYADLGVNRNIQDLTELFSPHFALIGYIAWSKNNLRKHPGELVTTGLSLNKRYLTDCEESEDLISISSQELESQVSYDYLKFEKCSDHKENFKNIYCQECKDTVCCYCFLMVHKGHEGDYLWQTSADDVAAMDRLKKDVSIVLQQLCSSYKKMKKDQVLDSSKAIPFMRKYLFDLHAKLHVAELNIKRDLESSSLRNNNDLDELVETVKQRIIKVRQLLSHFDASNNQSINIRQLLKEADDIKSLPCRLDEEDQLDPTCYIDDVFGRIEENFTIDCDRNNYILKPIDNWNDVESFDDLGLLDNTSTGELNREVELKATKKIETQKLPGSCKSDEDVPIKIVLTHLNSLDSFYVIKHEHQSKIYKMNLKIWKRIRTRLRHSDIKINYVYGVLFNVDNGEWWRRGRIQEIIKNNDFTQYKIFYIDFGNSQIITIDRLKELDSYFTKCPGYAIECRLSNPENLVFEENIHLQLPSLIDMKELYMQYVNNSSCSPREVDILLSTNINSFVSVKELLLKKKIASSKKEPLVLKREISLFPNSNQFSIGQEAIVEITCIQNPYEIFARLAKNRNQIQKLKIKMAAFYIDHKTSIIPVAQSYAVVNYTHHIEGEWHRCNIKDVNVTTREADIFFVDWGGFATVSWSNVYSLTEEFTTSECLAFSLKLSDIETIDKNMGMSWSCEATNFLREQFLHDRNCNMQVVNDDPLEVALFQERSTEYICLNALLVEKGYAFSTGNVSESVFWPTAMDSQQIDTDDDLISQTIKKSQDNLLENEENSFNRHKIKQQVEIMHFESPDSILIKFNKFKEKEDEMQRDLQIHYSAIEKVTKKEWNSQEYCVVFDKVKNNYFRGIVRQAINLDCYLVYLYDYGYEVKIQRQFIFEFDKYFKQFFCYVIKCRLAHIRPAGNGEKWTKLALEILQKIFKNFKILYVQKEASNLSKKLLSVEMWYSLIKPVKALEPMRQDYISINRLLVECGVAFGEKLFIEKPLDTFSKDQLNINLTTPEFVEVTKTANWNRVVCEDETTSSWPSFLKLTKTKFSAELICIDDEGCFLIRDEELIENYSQMESNIKESMSALDAIDENETWQTNDLCMILYENQFYRGKVIDIAESDVDNNIHVEMIDFGSDHKVSKKEISKYLMHVDCPPLLYKVQMYNVHSKQSRLSDDDIETLINLATDNIEVIIKSDLSLKYPLAEIYLENGLSINDLITENYSHLYRVIMTENNIVDSDNAKEETSINDNLFVYPFLLQSNIGRKQKVNLLHVLKEKDEFKVVFDDSNGGSSNNQDFKKMNKVLQSLAENQPRLKFFNIDDPCVCFYSNLWRRGIIHDIENINYGYVLVFFVDYGILDVVSADHIRQMDPLWFNIPVHNILATVNIKLKQKNMGEIVLMQLGNLRGKSMDVCLSSIEPLRVHLYKNEEFCYQDFINREIIVPL